ncbi:MAG: exonuclease [Faecalibacterium sp.]
MQQTFRGEIVEIGAVKIDEDANVLDTFSIHLRPRIFRKLQHHIARSPAWTQADLDKGSPSCRACAALCSGAAPDAEFAEWGMDDVPVLASRTFTCAILTSPGPPSGTTCSRCSCGSTPQGGRGYDAGKRRHPHGYPHGAAVPRCTFRYAVHRRCLPSAGPAGGLAAYPTEDEALRASLCPAPGDYRDFEVFHGYVEQYTWRTDPKIYTMNCPECGAPLTPDDVWLKKGSNSWYTLSQCPRCAGGSSAAGKGVFQRYKLARRDGLHWSYARCLQMPDDASLDRWEKQRTAQLERMKARAEKQAAE